MILFKNWQFCYLFILGKMGRENVFHDISKRKNSYQDYKDNVEVKIVEKL